MTVEEEKTKLTSAELHFRIQRNGSMYLVAYFLNVMKKTSSQNIGI